MNLFKKITVILMLLSAFVFTACDGDGGAADETPHIYTVTFDSQGGSPVDYIEVTSPATIIGSLPAEPTKTGYIFADWYTGPGGGGTEFTGSTPVTSDITVYAKWNGYTYTVTFDSQGGTGVDKIIVSSPATTVNPLPVSTNTNPHLFIFGGWYTEINGGVSAFTENTPVTADITVHARWIVKTMYAIGEIGPSGVGIVFYITDGGLHGLEAAPSGWNGGTGDPYSVWSNINRTIGVQAQGTAIGTGFANSNAIIAQSGHTSSAAKLCRDYKGGEKTDWFLPSRDELNKLYKQKNGVGAFAATYWSSSEYGSSKAWYQNFDIDYQNNNYKENGVSVRAVRAF